MDVTFKQRWSTEYGTTIDDIAFRLLAMHFGTGKRDKTNKKIPQEKLACLSWESQNAFGCS